MSKKTNYKKFLYFALVILSGIIIFTFVSGVFKDGSGTSGSKNENDSELEVEIIFSEENLDEIEEETEEKAIEDDLEQLDPKDESDEMNLEKNPAEKAALLFLSPAKTHPSELRIGLITDIHAKSYPETGNKLQLFDVFIDRVNKFVEETNDSFGSDAIIINGDAIEGTKLPARTGMEELRLLKTIFDRSAIPKYWNIGNHDLRAVTKVQWQQALKIDYTHKAIMIKNHKVILLDSNFDSGGKDVFPSNGFTRGNVSDKEISWLEKQLAGPEKKIVFVHHPPLRGIESRNNSGLLKNAKELQRLFSENNVLAVFAGHIEDLYYEKTDGVRYYVIPGVVKNPDYQGTFANIKISQDDEIDVDVTYLGKNGKYRTVRIEEK